MHCAVIEICCQAACRHEYVCVTCHYNSNALRCDVDLLLVWTAAGIRFCCLLLQLWCTALWYRFAAGPDGGSNTLVLFFTAIVMHWAVILNCCWSGRRQEYVSVACYCYCNELRCDIELLPGWTVAGILLWCLLLQLQCIALWYRTAAILDFGRNTFVLLVTAILMYFAVI